VTFNVSADAYGRFMGRYSEPLAVQFAKLAGVRAGQRALDVGCGPGALTAQLVDRLGAEAVSAVDPSPSFVEAVRERFPDVDAQSGTAEQLPFLDDSFDLTLAQLVVHFMSDPVAGLREMARVTRPGGLVAACVWDHAPGGRGPLTTFWQAARDINPLVRDESELAGAREGHLAELSQAAGLNDIESSALTVSVRFATFDEWWESFTLGVGPAGAHVAQLDESGRDTLRARCAQLLPPAPFEVTASAWCVRARA
jgi:ubiquinone/menaquinone biosynthesis C-methylase UbiE